MMTELLIAAAALAEASTGATLAGPAYDLGETEIVVEAGRGTRDWSIPKTDYDVAIACPALVETALAGFGMLRVGRDCSPPPADQSGFWPRLGK